MKKSIITAANLFLFVFLLSAASKEYDRPILGSDTWPPPEGQIGEDALAFKTPSRTYENAYTGMIFFTPDGWKAASNIFIFKLGPNIKYGITVSVSDKNYNYFLGKAEIDPAKFKFDPKSAEISFGESFIKGKNPNYHVKLVTDNITVDVMLKSRVGLWAVNGNGKFHLDAENKWFFNAAFASAWADVTGTLTIKGKTYKIDNGQGYMDHGHWSVPFNRHNPLWEGFMAWTWEPIDGHMYALQISDFLTHPEYGGKRLADCYVIRDNKFVCTTPKFKILSADFRKEPRTGIEFPWRFDARTFPDAPCEIIGASKAEKAWEVLDIFDELPPYIRPVVKKFLTRPVYFRAMGTFSGTLKCGKEEVRFNNIPAFHDANYIR